MRRLKVDIDLDSGSLVIRTTLMDFRAACTEAAAHNSGLLSFIVGVESLINTRCCPEPIPLITRSEKASRDAVECTRLERLLLDRIIEDALAVQRTKKEY